MADRKLTWEQATDLRETRARTGASYAMLAMLYRVDPRCAWDICEGNTYKTEIQVLGRPADKTPTPHDQLTYADWNRSTTPLPPLEAIHNGYSATYAAQNERDGYQRDPALRAWLFYNAPWATEDVSIAAD